MKYVPLVCIHTCTTLRINSTVILFLVYSEKLLVTVELSAISQSGSLAPKPWTMLVFAPPVCWGSALNFHPEAIFLSSCRTFSLCEELNYKVQLTLYFSLVKILTTVFAELTIGSNRAPKLVRCSSYDMPGSQLTFSMSGSFLSSQRMKAFPQSLGLP